MKNDHYEVRGTGGKSLLAPLSRGDPQDSSQDANIGDSDEDKRDQEDHQTEDEDPQLT